MTPMHADGVEFLRSIGTPDAALAILRDGGQGTVTADVLAVFLRAAYVAGRRDNADPYVWYEPGELIDISRAVSCANSSNPRTR